MPIWHVVRVKCVWLLLQTIAWDHIHVHKYAFTTQTYLIHHGIGIASHNIPTIIIWATNNCTSTWPAIKCSLSERLILTHKSYGFFSLFLAQLYTRKIAVRREKTHKITGSRISGNNYSSSAINDSAHFNAQRSFCIHQTLQGCFNAALVFHITGIEQKYISRDGYISIVCHKNGSMLSRNTRFHHNRIQQSPNFISELLPLE